MTVVDTSTAETATAYSNQRKIDRCQNGVLWATHLKYSGSAKVPAEFIELNYSTDDGETWTQGGYVANASGGTGTTHQGNFSFFIDLDDYAHIVFKDNSNGYIYYRRGTPNAGRTAWTWSAATTVYSDTQGDYPDVVVHREGTGWAAHIIISHRNVAFTQATYQRVVITSAGAVSLSGSTVAVGFTNSAGAPCFASIDFNHTGDGKTVAGGTPHLYVAWSNGATGSGQGIRFKKATYSGGTWNWGTEREIDSTRYVRSGAYWLQCAFDGTKVVIVGSLDDATTGGAELVVCTRDAADTTTTAKSDPLTFYYGSSAVDASGNVWIVGRHVANGDLRSVVWEAGASAPSTPTLLAPCNSTPYVSVKRGHSNNRIEFVYTDGTSSPYNVTYGSVVLNVAPNAPSSLSPDGGTIDKDITQRFSWTFSDPDAGDSQSAYDLRYRVQGTSTWTEVSGGATEYHDFAGGTFTADDWEWQVRTTDNAGVTGPWSALATFTAAATPAAPTISDPVNGGTIPSESYNVEWTAASQGAYQVRTVADDGSGSPDAATVYEDTGTVISSSARSRTMSFETNNRDEHVQVRVREDGLWSSWASVSVTVSYTEPAAPSIVTAADSPVAGAIRISHVHPTPTGDEPTVVSVDLWRRETLRGGSGERIRAGKSPSEPLDIYTSRSGVDYEFRLVAHGDNGTSSSSPWTA